VLINNEMWRETLASVPFEKRLLLLPKCLRVENKCPAPFDEFGLLCKQCGLCTIQDLQAEADEVGVCRVGGRRERDRHVAHPDRQDRGYRGSELSERPGKGLPFHGSCGHSGVAVPLLQDDCIDTTVDLDWVWDYIHLTSDDRTRRMDLGALKDEVETAFTPTSLELIFGTATGETERIARSG
jgi:geranylgeranyl diphosphate synthase type II